ncbi:hypothetical protein [Ekhidna sp.]|uniref:hypothetical protein n=1 Tax=Ekhidna sp. TaxID=2608089 RepID=UPI0035199E3E
MEVDKKSFNLLVAIINHNHNQEGIALKNEFGQLVDTILIDSGSTFEGDEREHFDFTLPNVYYNGLLNQAHVAMKPGHTHLLLITSDVVIEDFDILLTRMKEVYTQNPKVAVYAPSAVHSTHHHMNNLKSNDIRKVTFTEGFCFAMPRPYLDEICPIDLSINKIGHGIDMYMGYLSMKNNCWAVVDDKVVVDHPHGSGYSDKQARIERDRWYATKSTAAQAYHYWISKDILKNKFGYFVLKFIMRFYRL